MDPREHARGGLRLAHAIPAAVLLAFLAAGVARLNPFCLLEPDSPDYLFTSRALALGEGYREIDQPVGPLHKFRPPGLPLLLAPLSAARPYDVVGAKVVLLLLGAAMLALIFVLARRLAGTVPAMAALLLVAASPYTLLHATEVVTEVPYVVGSLGLILVVMGRKPSLWRWEGWAAAMMAVFVPFLRTIGITFVGALGLWGLTRRSRLGWLASAAAGAAATGLWALRNRGVDGPSYLTGIVHDLSTRGAAGTAWKALEGLGFYLARLSDVLLPGLGGGRPLYERVMVDPAPEVGAPGVVTAALTSAIVVLMVVGLFARRSEEGLLVVLYLGLFLAALAVYPPRHERLLWPLVPLVWTYSAHGAARTFRLLRPAPRRWAEAAAGIAVAGLVVVQTVVVAAMIGPEHRRSADADRFHREEVPPVYYADWPGAGRWLRENTPAYVRVLTRHSDLGFSSRRYQEALRLSETSPADLHEHIQRIGLRYLVIYTGVFGAFAPAWLAADPVYELRPVYHQRDVMVLEILPNRTGLVDGDPRSPGSDLEACRKAVERQPGRIELRHRLAELLQLDGRPAEAEQVLRDALDEIGDDARLHASLGSLLLASGRDDEALQAFRTAARAPGAEWIRAVIEGGLRDAEAGRALRDLPPGGRVRALVDRALAAVETFAFERAAADLEEAIALAPDDAAARYARGTVLQRLGRTGRAMQDFEAAARGGHPDAGRKLSLLALDRALAGAGDEAGPADYLELAGRWVQDGVPGRALAVLETAAGRFPTSGEVALRVADLYRFFALPERSEPLYLRLLETAPDDERARHGLQETRALLAEATF